MTRSGPGNVTGGQPRLADQTNRPQSLPGAGRLPPKPASTAALAAPLPKGTRVTRGTLVAAVVATLASRRADHLPAQALIPQPVLPPPFGKPPHTTRPAAGSSSPGSSTASTTTEHVIRSTTPA